MAAIPMGEIGRMVADVLGGSVSRSATVPADPMTFAYHMQGTLSQAVEAHLNTLRANPSKALDREQYSPGTVGGKGGPPVHNVRWSGRDGLRPGFTVIMRQSKQRVTQVRLVGRVTTPWAIMTGLVLGAAFEALWFPPFAANFLRWGPLFVGLYIVAIMLTTALIYWILVKITNTVFISLIILGLCAGAAVGLSFLWGFLGGFLIGWVMVTRVVAAGSGAVLRGRLRQALDGAAESLSALQPPPVYMPAPYWPAVTPAASYVGPPPGAVPAAYVQVPGYSSPMLAPIPTPPPPARAPTPRLASPPAPPLKSARVAAAPADPFTATAPSEYPCPTCGAPLPDGAGRCAACQTDIVWG
ncbi:MAG TPA: hypothetical protein VGB42_00285 [Candidatus Thermoplasmatota archaeon]